MSWLALVPVIAAVVAFFVYLKHRQDAVEEVFRAKFAGRDVLHLDKNATFVARESAGYSQTRGRGYLVLTKSELYFMAVLAQTHVSVPTESIRHVERTHRLAGQSPGCEMLKVEFTARDGHHDAIALIVSNIDEWIAALQVYASDAPTGAPQPASAPQPAPAPEAAPVSSEARPDSSE